MNYDVSKLYFMPGALRYSQQSEFPYISLLKLALEQLGFSPSGVVDGDKGDIVVSGSGLVWTLKDIAISKVTGLQTALDSKAPKANPIFTGVLTAPDVVVSNATPSTIAIFDASKKVVSASVSTYPSLTELTYLKGVTSPIQIQFAGKAPLVHTHIIADITGLQAALNAKAPLNSPTFTGTVTLPTGQVVNGVTLRKDLGTSVVLLGDGTYGAGGGGGGGTPGGSTLNVQFNNGGVFGGENDFTYNNTTNKLTVPSVALSAAPANDDALTQILVRDGSTGDIKYRAAASFGASSLEGDI